MTAPEAVLTFLCARCDHPFRARRILDHCTPCTVAAAADTRHAGAHRRARTRPAALLATARSDARVKGGAARCVNTETAPSATSSGTSRQGGLPEW